jgi:hypothetical protein
MVTKNKKTPPKKISKKPSTKKVSVKLSRVTLPKFLTPIVSWLQRLFRPLVTRVKKLMSRRPHRSFRLTKRRDYKRSLKLPGYFAFTNFVRKTLWKKWRLFGGLVVVYVVVAFVISGFSDQQTYSDLAQALQDGSGDLFKGDFGPVAQAGLLLMGTVTKGLTPDITQPQTILGGLAVFFGWLSTIWLLRNSLAGHNPRLRDGLYNSGAPVLATILVGFIITLQLLPSSIGLIIYTAAANSGMLEGGVSAMLVWISVILLAMVSIYWISSSFIALVIVTLPGMYPMQAIRAAGDLVVGRRLRMLYRLVWLLLVTAAAWLIVMIPLILFDDWVKKLLPAISWVPLVPFLVIVMSSLTLIFSSSYIYLLYRRVVDDDDGPA